MHINYMQTLSDDHHHWGRAWAVLWHGTSVFLTGHFTQTLFHTFLHKAQHMYMSIRIMHVQVLSRMRCACAVLYVEKCKKKFVWSDRREKLAHVKDGDTNKKVRFAGLSLSFQPRSSLRRCLCFSSSHCWHSWSCNYHHYALHCSPLRT